MFWASYLLAVLAIILAWPVPILLSRAQWPARSPFTAMLLWQAIALAGGLSMIGAMLVYGLEPVGDNLIAGLRALAGMVLFNAPTTALGFWHIFALSAAALLTAHLVFTLLLTYYKIQRQRRRHRELLAILASPSGQDAGTLVLSHENAHLSQRHHLLLWAFAAWRQALPWLPTTRLAQESVNSLIDMLADDVALKTESKATLIRAIAIVASGSPATPAVRLAFGEPGVADGDPSQPGATGGSGSAGTTASRVSRLLSPQPPLSEPLRAAVLACCVLLLAVPTALLLVPGLLG